MFSSPHATFKINSLKFLLCQNFVQYDNYLSIHCIRLPLADMSVVDIVIVVLVDTG